MQTAPSCELSESLEDQPERLKAMLISSREDARWLESDSGESSFLPYIRSTQAVTLCYNSLTPDSAFHSSPHHLYAYLLY